MKRPTLLIPLLAASILFTTTSARAEPVFTVNSTLDQIDDDTSDGICHTAANTCTLRAAVMQADAVVGAGVTIMVPAGTYVLTRAPVGDNGPDSGDLTFTTPTSGNPIITVTGTGADNTIIDANHIDRVIGVFPNRTAIINDISVRNGDYIYGGGIGNSGILTLNRCVVEHNSAVDGGGIFNNNTITIADSSIRSNVSSHVGGGIHTSSTLVVDRSTISGNVAALDGAGIANYFTMILRNTTISHNYANRDGGGVFTTSGNSNIYNMTIVGNEADHDQDYFGSGGGIYTYGEAVFNLRNSLVARNTVSNSPTPDDCSGTVSGFGRNLFGSYAGCTVNGTSALLNSVYLLGPLQDNGGPTFTHALLPGSNAIDGGDPVGGCVDEGSNALPTDQRGYARVSGTYCDVGAYEYSDRIFKNGFE